MYRGTKIKMTEDSSLEIMQAGTQWSSIFKVLIGKKKKGQSRFSYPTQTSFKDKGEVKTFSDIGKLIERIMNRTSIQEMLKEIL